MRHRQFHGRLKNRGYRVTAARKAILEVLSRTNGHLSAEDIFGRIRKTCPSSGLTTVYRTLDVLVETGMVSRHDFGDGRGRYELSDGHSFKKHHHHLVCKVCRRVIDYTEFSEEELAFLKKTQEGLARKYGFEIDDHEIAFRGRCPSCRKAA